MKKIFFANLSISLILFFLGLKIVDQKFSNFSPQPLSQNFENTENPLNSMSLNIGKPIPDTVYNKIIEGMTVDQVEKIIGRKGFELSNYESEGQEYLGLLWEYEQDEKVFSVHIDFINEKVSYKSKLSKKK
jgi:hypothetical protein